MTSLITLPGLIDCHVHFREPGLEHKETMKTGSAAARAGGVLTVCEMPNTNPPTVTIAALVDKVRRASLIKDCDIRFFFGATEPQHLLAFRKIWLAGDAHMKELKARCCGLKLYFDHSTGNQGASDTLLDDAFKLCGELGAQVVGHCEDAEMNQEERLKIKSNEMEAHSLMRPPESEEKAVAHAISLAKKHGTKFHVAHLSTAGGRSLVRKAKSGGLPITCEVAPHHLLLTVDDYEHLGSYGKMNPPLRTREHLEALWAGIADGTVDCISTDHAPHTREEKDVTLSSSKGDLLKIPSGVPGVETMLPLLLTVVNGGWPNPHSEKPKDARLQMSDIRKLCFENPNRIFNLGKSEKGESVTIDMDAKWTIKGGELHSKCGWTPYENWEVTGKVV